jgi:protein-disulfide isomerase
LQEIAVSQNNKLRIVAVIIVMVLVGLYFANSQNENGATVDAGVENAETTETQAAPVSDAGALGNDNPLGEIMIGAADAPVTIVEYASLTCGHCGDFHRTTLPLLKGKYVDTGKVNIKFRPFPLDEYALTGAMLAQCVAPKQRVAFLDILFARQGQWMQSQRPIDDFQSIARQAGLSEADFVVCLKDENILAGVRDMQKQAAEELGIRSTPTFFINGTKLEGNRPIEDFDALIIADLPADMKN